MEDIATFAEDNLILWSSTLLRALVLYMVVKISMHKEDLSILAIFHFIQAMGIEAIKAETSNIHYTAYQFWKQVGPKTLLLDIVKRLLVLIKQPKCRQKPTQH